MLEDSAKLRPFNGMSKDPLLVDLYGTTFADGHSPPGRGSRRHLRHLWHEGCRGPHVGFCGGFNDGFKYFGSGFVGGYWRDHDFHYNRAAADVSNASIANVCDRSAINSHNYGSRPSFSGAHGVQAQPARRETLAVREPHHRLLPPHATNARTWSTE